MLTIHHTSSDNSNQLMDLLKDQVDQLIYGKGQVIYCKGSTPLGAYFVHQGKVKTSIIGSDGKEQILSIATSGDMLGYANMISGTKYSTSAKALDDCTLYFIPKHEFLNYIKSEAQLLEKFVTMTSGDILQAETKIVDLAYKPVRGRLADALLHLCTKFDRQANSSLSIAITRNDLACFVGTAKETVNRFLSEFRNEGLISTEGTVINIQDVEGLNRVSDLYS